MPTVQNVQHCGGVSRYSPPASETSSSMDAVSNNSDGESSSYALKWSISHFTKISSSSSKRHAGHGAFIAFKKTVMCLPLYNIRLFVRLSQYSVVISLAATRRSKHQATPYFRAMKLVRTSLVCTLSVILGPSMSELTWTFSFAGGNFKENTNFLRHHYGESKYAPHLGEHFLHCSRKYYKVAIRAVGLNTALLYGFSSHEIATKLFITFLLLSLML
jgi:hypothetical protein